LLGVVLYLTFPDSSYLLIAAGALFCGVREALKWAARD
jgi:hypothetical protein